MDNDIAVFTRTLFGYPVVFTNDERMADKIVLTDWRKWVGIINIKIDEGNIIVVDDEEENE